MPREQLPGINDLVRLKLEKKMLQESLAKVNAKNKKLETILAAKAANPASSLYRHEDPSSTTMARGHSLQDFRNPSRSVKAVSKVKIRDLDAIDPTPIPKGSQLERIRIQHICRTTGKREVNRQKREIEERKRAEEVKREQKVTPVNIPASQFPNRYSRGELPCSIEHGVKGLYLSWVCPLENLDYEYYLPIFFDGLQCTERTLVFLASQGIEDMLFASQGHPERILPCIKNLVRPIRNALSKFHVPTLLVVLKALRQLVQCNEGIGEALTPYYKQFLAPMNAFLEKNKNTGDTMDYGQRKNDDVGEEVRNTLEIMERLGGPDAYRSIKFSIPPYQSYRKGI